MKNFTILIWIKKSIFLLLSLLSFEMFSQEAEVAEIRGIILERKTDSRKDFLTENKRIKLELETGKIVTGKFIILNDSTISIQKQEISLASIIRIKRRSLVSAIGSPIVTTYGLGGIGLGIYAVSQGGLIAVFGGALIPPSIVLVLLSAISENHRQTKWNYSIGNKPIPKFK